MEKKKTEKADLENKKALFMQIGLVLTLAGVLVAFEWKTYEIDTNTGIQQVVAVVEEEVIIQTSQNAPPPPPPPPEVTTELEIVDDDKEIEDEVNVDAETKETQAVEMYFAPAVAEEEAESEDVPFTVVEVSPGFPGGEEARLKYLRDNLDYPVIARESGIQGTIYVTFVVERDGSITDVKVMRGIGGGCDEEAIRVVQKMPKWAPGQQRGKPVRVQFMMPIKFVLGT